VYPYYFLILWAAQAATHPEKHYQLKRYKNRVLTRGARTRDIACVRELLHHHFKFFLFCTLAAIGLRLIFIFKFPVLQGDTFVYGDIAKNWLLHGVYGLTNDGVAQATYIRLPGYPTFLAILFKIFGMEHYNSAMFTQVVVDLGTCFVVSALALEITRAQDFAAQDASQAERPALIAFLLTALCPFLANFVATPLTETWAIFFTALALYLAVKGLGSLFHGSPGYWKWWLGCGFALGAGLLFRPDTGIVLAMTGAVLLPLLFKFPKRTLVSGLLTLMAVMVLLTPWTVRNWRTMGHFEPLAPRYANDPGEFVSTGFYHWLKTWVVDYISVYNVEWHVDGEKIAMEDLPPRACDSQQECAQTQALVDSYNDGLTLSPEVDAQFNELAQQRIRQHPFRYYVWLPALRITDMWLRPRVDMLPLDIDWWRIDDNGWDSWIAIGLGALNLILILLALIGMLRVWPRHWISAPALIFVLLVGFVVVRSLFLGTLENPEPRYTLECFPVVLAFAGVAFVRKKVGPSS